MLYASLKKAALRCVILIGVIQKHSASSGQVILRVGMREFIWNEDGTAILKVEDISSIEICPINEDEFRLQAVMQNGNWFTLETIDNIQEAKQALANWENRLVFYYAKKKWQE